MALVLLKAPPPVDNIGKRAEGMVDGSPLAPGHPPPFLIPHCRQCNVPVERFTIDWVCSPFYLPIQFSCHGRTSGMKVSQSNVLKASREGGLLWVFTETRPNGKSTPR